MDTLVKAYSETPRAVTHSKESPADAKAFELQVKRQIRQLMMQSQKDPTFYVPCLAPEHMTLLDTDRMLAAFVLFSHETIFRLCPESHVWLEGEFWHSIYRINGIGAEPELVFKFRHQRVREADELLSSYDLIRPISLKLLPDGQLNIADGNGNVFTY